MTQNQLRDWKYSGIIAKSASRYKRVGMPYNNRHMASEDERTMSAVTDVGEKIAASNGTTVFEQGDRNVLKADSHIYQLKRESGESDEDYRRRRFEKCLSFIKKQLASEEMARRLLPDRINAPHEFHLIAEGKDGFPAPFRIQEKISGKTLKKMDDLPTLNEQQQNDLNNLLQASLDGYRKYGRLLTIVGSVEGEVTDLLAEIKKFWSPLENSNNIMISPDGTISLVDVRLSKKSPLKDAVKFLLIFSYLYRRKLQRLTTKEGA